MSTKLRIAYPDDAQAVVSVYAPYCESTVISFEAEPPSIDEMRRRITVFTERFPWLLAECDGRVVGYAYASPHAERAAYRWSADVAVYLDADYHRRGIGRRLYAVLFSLLKQLGCHRLCAGVTLPNAASVALHESLGFTPVGVYHKVGYKMGKWHDVGWWELSLAETDLDPPEPIAFSRVRDSQQVRNLIDSA